MHIVCRSGCCALLLALSFAAARGAETLPLEEEQFEDVLRGIAAERSEADQLRRAKAFAVERRLSSMQVKTLAARLRDDSARLEFALAAYPRTVDPENFYEVYDAFTSFSKVMRLHDAVRPGTIPGPRPGPGPVVTVPETMGEADMKPILQALRKETFDPNRAQLARQILTSSRRLFRASQIKQMVECFDFEPSKLELAKFAYDYTYDREKYFLVNDAFSFSNTKDALSRYVESKSTAPPRR